MNSHVNSTEQSCQPCSTSPSILFGIAVVKETKIVRLLVATLHVRMTGKQDGGYTQLT